MALFAGSGGKDDGPVDEYLDEGVSTELLEEWKTRMQ